MKCEGDVVCCWLRMVPTEYLTEEVDLSQGEPRRRKIDVQVKDCLDTKVA